MTDSQLKVSELPASALLRNGQRLFAGATVLFSIATRAILGVSKESPKPDAGVVLGVSKESPKPDAEAILGVSKESPNRAHFPSKRALTERDGSANLDRLLSGVSA